MVLAHLARLSLSLIPPSAPPLPSPAPISWSCFGTAPPPPLTWRYSTLTKSLGEERHGEGGLEDEWFSPPSALADWEKNQYLHSIVRHFHRRLRFPTKKTYLGHP